MHQFNYELPKEFNKFHWEEEYVLTTQTDLIARFLKTELKEPNLDKMNKKELQVYLSNQFHLDIEGEKQFEAIKRRL